MTELIEKWLDLRQRRDELDKRCEKYRLMVQDHMRQNNLDVVQLGEHRITKSSMKRESISKKDVPQDLWDKYHKTSLYTVLRVWRGKKEITE